MGEREDTTGPVFEAWDPRFASPALRRVAAMWAAGSLGYAALVWGGGEWELATGFVCMTLLEQALALRGWRRTLRIDASGIHRRVRSWPRLLPWEVVTEVRYDPRMRELVFWAARHPRALALQLRSYDGEELPRAIAVAAAHATDGLHEHVEGSQATDEDALPWPAGSTLRPEVSRMTWACVSLLALSLAWWIWYGLRHYAWAHVASIAALAWMARWSWSSRVRIHAEGLEVWRIWRIRTQCVPWGEISGFDGGGTGSLTVRRHRDEPVPTLVHVSPGHFTRLQATLRQHGVEAVFA
ncbi:MAG: hypothetical protein AB7T63_13980 [Planctomycetota bacterium]